MNYCNPDDPRVAGEAFQHIYINEKKIEENVSYIISNTSKSGLSVCSAVSNVLEGANCQKIVEQENGFCTSLEMNAVKDQTVTLYKYTILCDSLEDAQSMETIRTSFAYYETITTHDSSLSTCIYSIVASKLGLEKKAYEYFGESAKLDLFNTHKNTRDGIHTANMGGTYMAIIYGFAGLRIKESGLYLAPHLPEKWDDYQFRILYEDSKINVQVGEKVCCVESLLGTPKEIFVYGERYLLTDKLEIRRA